MNRSQENFSDENPECHIWPERTQQAEYFVTELGLCDISLKSSIQDNHEGYRKLRKLR